MRGRRSCCHRPDISRWLKKCPGFLGLSSRFDEILTAHLGGNPGIFPRVLSPRNSALFVLMMFMCAPLFRGHPRASSLVHFFVWYLCVILDRVGARERL